MAKAKSKKQNKRADPISKKEQGAKAQRHLYTDDNPETTLKGTGFKDAEAASTTISLVSKRSLTYQFQLINTMYNRAKHHPAKTKDIDAAIATFHKWLKETYPKAKAEQRSFKPLSKKTVEAYLPQLEQAEGIDTAFAELYVNLEARKRLANVLVNENEPGEPDWDRTRKDKLSELVPDKNNEVDDDELWEEDGQPSEYHLSLISWAWSPTTEYKLLKAVKG